MNKQTIFLSLGLDLLFIRDLEIFQFIFDLNIHNFNSFLT